MQIEAIVTRGLINQKNQKGQSELLSSVKKADDSLRENGVDG
ncbi:MULTISPECIES: hypothetical protein [Peribacillus]|nr:hypothetical protein [Peribacillus simplex]